MKYRVKIYCERTCWDYAYVDVNASDETDARSKAYAIAYADEEIEWQPATVETYESTGQYSTSDIVEVIHEDS